MTGPRVTSTKIPQPIVSEEFTVAINHPYQCRCSACLAWWAQVGPEPDKVFIPEDDYGPFTEAEVEAEIARLAAPE